MVGLCKLEEGNVVGRFSTFQVRRRHVAIPERGCFMIPQQRHAVLELFGKDMDPVVEERCTLLVPNKAAAAIDYSIRSTRNAVLGLLCQGLEFAVALTFSPHRLGSNAVQANFTNHRSYAVLGLSIRWKCKN